MPLRIPVYERQVKPAGAQGLPNQVRMPEVGGYDALQRGFNSLGGAVDQAVEQQKRDEAKYQRELEEAKHKADVVAANDALTKYSEAETTLMDGSSTGRPVIGKKLSEGVEGEQGQSSVDVKAPETEYTPGFLSTQGKAAPASSAETLDALEKRRRDIAGELSNPEQRALFDQHSRQMYESTRKRVEDHVAREIQRAEVASVEARKAAALNAIANNYTDAGFVQNQVAGVVGPMSALALSKEDAQAKVDAWQAEVAKVRLTQYLADKDWKGAQALFAQTREQLGAQGTHFANAIRLEREKSEADQLALSIVDKARLPTGFVEPATAIAAFQALPEGQRTEAAQQAFAKWLQLETAKKKAAVDGVYDSALTQYLQRHTLRDVSSTSEAWLRVVDPESWRKLEQMQKADAAHARGAPATPAQDRAMAQFRLWAADNPDLAAQMSEADFNRSWAPLLARSDRDNAVGVLAGYHAFANKPEKIANAVDAAVQEVGGKGGAGVLPTEKRNKADWAPEDLDVYARVAARLQQKANEFRRQSGGKEPTVEDLRKWAKDEFLAGKNPEGGFLGFGGGTTKVEAEVKGTGFTPSFGPDERAQAAEALRKANVPRVDDAAVEAYLRAKHDLPALPQQAAPVKEPEPFVKPPSTEVDALYREGWGLHLEEPELDLSGD